MATINLNRAPFLAHAMTYIRDNAGCCKKDVIVSYPHSRGGQYGMPSRTYANRNAAIGRLVKARLVRDCGNFSRCELYIVE